MDLLHTRHVRPVCIIPLIPPPLLPGGPQANASLRQREAQLGQQEAAATQRLQQHQWAMEQQMRQAMEEQEIRYV